MVFSFLSLSFFSGRLNGNAIIHYLAPNVNSNSFPEGAPTHEVSRHHSDVSRLIIVDVL